MKGVINMIKDIVNILFYDPDKGWVEDTLEESKREEIAKIISQEIGETKEVIALQ